MPLSNDSWIAEYSTIDPERLHALGVITLYWNICERGLFQIFCTLFGFHSSLGWIIAHDMGDRSISERITEILKIRQNEPDEEASIENLLEVYDACRQNRNTFTHFMVNFNKLRPEPGDESNYQFSRMKGPSRIAKQFPSTLVDVRRVAADIRTLSIHIHGVNHALVGRSLRSLGIAGAPLPPTLALPALVSIPLPEADREPQPQRPPSVLRLTEEEWIAKYRKEGRPLPDREGE
ncbi:hypothetical protein SAMN05444164_5298 [Bradyrhizobium erythrophlei]|uniref:Uncharacterized protein n=1 Tax=Bradyrhizobium erythrophlei TaxID=1437360 RepID=A0A1H5C8G3_9BRAD|nr:hypothetical protein SAMN05444164_5298 [Bradyrhizobium erythrophlei]